MNRERLDSWDEDALLLVTSMDVSYFFFDAFLLVPGRIVFFDFWSSSTAWKCVKK